MSGESQFKGRIWIAVPLAGILLEITGQKRYWRVEKMVLAS